MYPVWALSIYHLHFKTHLTKHPQKDTQRIRGYLAESHGSLPFPDNKVVIIPGWAHLRERAWGDRSGTAYPWSLEWHCRLLLRGALPQPLSTPLSPEQGPQENLAGARSCQPVPAGPPWSPASFQLHKGASPARRGCSHYSEGTGHRHLSGKGTAKLSGLLFPLSYTGNTTTSNNALKPKGQAAAGIRWPVEIARCIPVNY